ncbi:MAG: tRNA pseudouridine(38-40) synthase TruA [Acholeplasmatales bacterium]|nr:tRNA pseudouridine(38-40) synthase TruA [Acholeplasmatales bacterium]
MQESIYNIKCVIEYDGSRYAGFQVQPNEITIESELLRVLNLICKEEIKIYGSGRTDRGVHAKGQVFNFFTHNHIPLDRFMYAFNRQLPLDIRVLSMEYVDLNFHARFSAVKKEYRYYLKQIPLNAFEHNYMAFSKKLDLNLVQNALKLLEGRHNFEGFCSVDVDKRKDFEKEIYEASVKETNDILEFKFIGSGFLKYQIRRMMALIIAIGLKEEKLETITKILETRDPFVYTKVADPSGLYLMHVYY